MHPFLSTPLGSVLSPRQRYTYADLLDLVGETNLPLELWNGTVLLDPMPSTDHQEIAYRFGRALIDFVAERKLGRAHALPIDMILSPGLVLQPDISFVATENFHRLGRALHGPADLVAEIVSPLRRGRDWGQKRSCYERHGVREYWVIDPQAQVIGVFGRASKGRYRAAEHYRPGETARGWLLPHFEVPVSNLLYREGV